MTAPLTVSAGDTAWLLVSTALVMVMVPGLALFYGGLVRSRSSLNTMMMSSVPLALVTVQWVLFGYSLSFAPGTGLVGGLSWAGLRGVGAAPDAAYGATVPHLAFAAFQAMFAAITVALVAGAVVERFRFRSFLLFVLLWTTLVYDPLAHWVWSSGGWLHGLGALDFAGGTVVHVSAGTAALVAARMTGPRRDFRRQPIVPHNVPFALLGAGLLWFGWFGFNAGSALAADGVAANALVTTQTAAATALGVWLLLDLRRLGHCTAVGAATGAVTGLVAITPAAGYVSPAGAIAVGALGAAASYAAIQLFARGRLDDSLDVFACHGVAGLTGALLTGVFATTAVNSAGADGWLAGHPAQLGVQALAVLATITFVGTGTAGILGALRLLGSLRVAVPVELAGIDLSEHGEEAYYGVGLASLVARGVTLGGSVSVPAAELHAGLRESPEGAAG